LINVNSSNSVQYTYDDANNLDSIQTLGGAPTTFAYNSVNQIDNVNFPYDANGNLLADNQHTYKWDAENRLLTIGYKATPTKETNFRYDGLGRRIAIIEKNGATTTETRYLWCDEKPCQSRNVSDGVLNRYFDEGEVQSGTKLYYAKDHLGSVRDVMSPTGSNQAAYDYDAYGNLIATSGTASTDFRYAGMFYHQPSNLYLTWYRAYDPKTSRWISIDPIGLNGGINFYGYVEGNPVIKADLNGLQSVIQLLPGTTAAVGATSASASANSGSNNAGSLSTYNPNDPYDLGYPTNKQYNKSHDFSLDSSDTLSSCPQQDNKERCKAVKNTCISECSITSLPTKHGDGVEFDKCVRSCMNSQGCDR